MTVIMRRKRLGRKCSVIYFVFFIFTMNVGNLRAGDYQSLLDSVFEATRTYLFNLESYRSDTSGFRPHEFSLCWSNPLFSDTLDVPGYTGLAQNFYFQMLFVRPIDSLKGLSIVVRRRQSRTSFGEMHETTEKAECLISGPAKLSAQIEAKTSRTALNRVDSLAIKLAGFGKSVLADSLPNRTWCLVPSSIHTTWRGENHFIPPKDAGLSVSYIDTCTSDSLNCVSLKYRKKETGFLSKIEHSHQEIAPTKIVKE